jgi:methionyl-tRNA formyltransferase
MEEIYRVGGHLDLAITLCDDQAQTKSGRVYLDEFCQAHAVDLFKTRNINDREAIEAIQEKGIDWLFIIGWSQIARKAVLEAPTRGVLGMHPTLLPVGRGRAAVPWAILKGLPETGVTLFKLDEGVDTGPILAQERIPMSPQETATSLYAKVNEAHEALICRVWPSLEADEVELHPQDDAEATVWLGRRPEDGEIVTTMSVDEVDRLVRAVTRPYPGAFIDVDGRRLRVWKGEPLEQGAAYERDLTLRLADGVYRVTASEWETLDG